MGLDLSFGRSLKALPKGLSNLKHLIYLHLENCQGLERLPKSIVGLRNLKNLNLKYCIHLKELPNSISKLEKLENLHLGFCSFTKLPKSLGQLKMLVVLDLEGCGELDELPPAILRLESLNLWGCSRVGQFNMALPSLTNLKMNEKDYYKWTGMSHVRSLIIDESSDLRQSRLKSMEEIQALTLHTSGIKVFSSHMTTIFLNLETLRLSFLPKLQSLGLNDCPNLVNLTLNDCPNLEGVALTNCPNLVCLPALHSLPRLGSLVLRLSIKNLPQSFTHRGAFPALNLFNLGQSNLVEFPEVEEGAMPKLQWLDFDDCISLHTLPASISLLTNIQTIDLGSKNEKLITSCKTNFRNSTIRKSFMVDGKPLIPEEVVFESLVPMEEGMTTVRSSEKRPFQKVHGDDEERLLKRGGSILGSDFFMPSSPKRFVYVGSSSLAETTKSEKEHGLCEAL
jgi:Leucine-rich repeat (LRR) protein